MGAIRYQQHDAIFRNSHKRSGNTTTTSTTSTTTTSTQETLVKTKKPKNTNKAGVQNQKTPRKNKKKQKKQNLDQKLTTPAFTSRSPWGFCFFGIRVRLFLLQIGMWAGLCVLCLLTRNKCVELPLLSCVSFGFCGAVIA